MRRPLLILTVVSFMAMLYSVGKADESLVLHLTFDKGEGTVAEDRSAHGNDGTLRDGATWTENGKYGNGVLLDGVKGGVTVEDSDDLDLKGQLTLEAWVYPHDVTLAYKGIISKEDWNNGKGFYLGQNAEEVYFGFDVAANEIQTTNKNFSQNEEWYHVAGTFDGDLPSSNLKIYVNGVLVKQGGASISPTPHDTTLDVGWIHDLQGFFPGIIDEVAVYRRALTAEEIKKDMEGIGAAVEPTGKLATVWARIKSH